jgi:GntR family transcriptional regulator
MSTKISTNPPELDRDADVPIWFQLMRIIETGIASGTWQYGDRIPSEHQLCAMYGISRTSVREALARLENAGILRREQGRGAFVATDSDSPWSWTLPSAPGLLGEYVERGRSALTSEVLRAELQDLPRAAADAFGDDRGFVLERSRAVGTLTAVHTIDMLPRRYAGVAATLRDPRASLFAALESVAGVRITRMQRTVDAVNADRHVAAVLGIEPGYPVVVVEAIAFDQRDNPVNFSRASVRTDRLRVAVDSGHEPEGLARSGSGLYREVS